MSLLDTAIAKGEDLLSHLKTLAEHDVPGLEALQASPIVRALEGIVLTPEAEGFIADTVSFLASRYGTQQPADPAAVAPADPAAVADPAPVA